MKLQTG